MNTTEYERCPYNSQKAKIERYEKTVGKLAIKNGVVIGLLNGKETTYISKRLHKIFKNMAVNRAKSEAYREFVEKIFESISVYKFENKSKEYRDGFMDAVNWCNEKIDNTLKELTEENK